MRAGRPNGMHTMPPAITIVDHISNWKIAYKWRRARRVPHTKHTQKSNKIFVVVEFSNAFRNLLFA